MNEPISFPQPPQISEEEWEACRESGDYCPISFEWYKFVGAACAFVAHIQIDSPALREIPAVHYAVVTGLLNRCARLMLSNLALSHEGKFGETTAIVDRCIFESAIKLMWLCHGDEASDRFLRYLADGLRTELELKKKISDAISQRGAMVAIEKRMLACIDRHISCAGLTDREVEQARKLPNLAAMIESLGQDRLTYIVGQRLGSHHIHGTWPSLVMHYLEHSDDGTFNLRGHDCDTHVNQYVVIPHLVLEAMGNFVCFIMAEQEDVLSMTQLFESIQKEIQRVLKVIAEGDWDIVERADPNSPQRAVD